MNARRDQWLLVIMASAFLMIHSSCTSSHPLSDCRATLRAVSSNHSSACIVGDRGYICSTTDGGEKWEVRESGTAQWLLTVDFVDSLTGWVSGASGTMLKTEDGGQSWEVIHLFVDHNLHACSFKDRSVGIAAGSDGIILGTRDGGQSWEIQNKLPGTVIYGATLLGRASGFAVGSGGLVLTTKDGGYEWSAVTLDSLTRKCNLYGVVFHDLETGYIYGANSTLLKTRDGGTTWSRVIVEPSVCIRDLVIHDPGLLIGVGDDGRIVLIRGEAEHSYIDSTFAGIDLYGAARLGRSRYLVVGSGGSSAQVTIGPEVSEIPAGSVDGSGRLQIDTVYCRRSVPSVSDAFSFAFGLFRGSPYVGDPLGEGLSGIFDQDPRFDFRHVDCVTALEQSLGLSICQETDQYLETMDRIRYRGGHVSFLNRNHFFVPDWIPANSWLIEDVTTNLGEGYTETVVRTVGRGKFLSLRDVDIPQMSDLADYSTIYIPSERVPEIASNIRQPHIVVFMSQLDWLFAGHVGMIYRDLVGGELILRHASSAAESVVDQPFIPYLEDTGKFIGIKLLAVDD